MLNNLIYDSTASIRNNILAWHTRDGYDQFLAGSVGSAVVVSATGACRSVDALKKGQWPFEIVQFDRKWCTIAALESCTNTNTLKKIPLLRKHLIQCQDHNGFADLRLVVEKFNTKVKSVTWKRVSTLFQGNTFISLHNVFSLLLSFEMNMKFYILSFLCGTTCHVVSIEACQKLILDSDSTVGREQAFHYEDMNDIVDIMKTLFNADMHSNVVSHVYVREKKKG